MHTKVRIISRCEDDLMWYIICETVQVGSIDTSVDDDKDAFIPEWNIFNAVKRVHETISIVLSSLRSDIYVYEKKYLVRHSCVRNMWLWVH